MPTSFLDSLKQALGLNKAGPATQNREVQKFVAQLKSDNPDQRRSAAWQLAKMQPRPKDAIPALEEAAAKDASEFVRRSANWALKVIRDK